MSPFDTPEDCIRAAGGTTESPPMDCRFPDQPAGEEPWSEPVDFLADGDLTGVPDLHEDHLPAPIFPFVMDTAIRMGVDPASVALAALVSIASVLTLTLVAHA